MLLVGSTFIGGIFLLSKMMANPDQKTILLEQAYDEIKVICTKFQDESGATDMEVKTLLRELARFGKKILMKIMT